jgi:hypothetical protein
MRISMALLVLLCWLPGRLVGQVSFLEGLFKNITDVGIYTTTGTFTDRPATLAGSLDEGQARSWGLTGLGLEASFFVGGLQPLDTGSDGKVAIDTLEVRSTTVDSVETKRVLVYKQKATPRDFRWNLELGLGYSELRGFVSTVDSVDIRGAVRELPAVSLYITYNSDVPVSFYGGLRTGLAQLQSFRAFVQKAGASDESYSASANTFQLGLVGGVIADVGPLTLFAEPAYTYRRFPGLEWSNINGSVDDRLARSLDMSSFTISFGGQFELGDLSKGK